ncbi:MAG: ATP-binding protein [Deltaproteobacteria bacterium]|nr:ATP-binding protein [Deltaproteobacteria bacterium]
MIVETLGSQVTYSSLTQRMGEISKPTFIDYCDLLERQDILFNLQAYDQNKRIGFPKKARKFHFWDPFILETIQRWLTRERFLTGLSLEPQKVESAIAAHFKKEGDTYYLKGTGEVDVVALKDGKPVYIEVKWTKQLRSSDLTELKKQRPAVILTKEAEGHIDDIPALPVARFLLNAGPPLI